MKLVVALLATVLWITLARAADDDNCTKKCIHNRLQMECPLCKVLDSEAQVESTSSAETCPEDAMQQQPDSASPVPHEASPKKQLPRCIHDKLKKACKICKVLDADDQVASSSGTCKEDAAAQQPDSASADQSRSKHNAPNLIALLRAKPEPVSTDAAPLPEPLSAEVPLPDPPSPESESPGSDSSNQGDDEFSPESGNISPDLDQDQVGSTSRAESGEVAGAGHVGSTSRTESRDTPESESRVSTTGSISESQVVPDADNVVSTSRASSESPDCVLSQACVSSGFGGAANYAESNASLRSDSDSPGHRKSQKRSAPTTSDSSTTEDEGVEQRSMCVVQYVSTTVVGPTPTTRFPSTSTVRFADDEL